MMRTLVYIPLLAALGLFSLFVPATQAGAPGPYRLVFFDISKAPYQDGQQLAIELRKMDKLSEVQKEYCFFCKSGDIGVVYLYSVPTGLNAEDLRQAVNGNDEARNRMQSILEKFTDGESFGVDGLLIYQHTEGKVTIYTMDKRVGSPLKAESKPVKYRLLHSSLDTLLNKAAEKLHRPV